MFPRPSNLSSSRGRAAIDRYQRAVAAGPENASPAEQHGLGLPTSRSGTVAHPARGLATAEKAVHASIKELGLPQHARRGLLPRGPIPRRDRPAAIQCRGRGRPLARLRPLLSRDELSEARGGAPGAGIPEPRPAMDAPPERARARRPSRACRDLARDGGDSRSMTTGVPRTGFEHPRKKLSRIPRRRVISGVRGGDGIVARVKARLRRRRSCAPPEECRTARCSAPTSTRGPLPMITHSTRRMTGHRGNLPRPGTDFAPPPRRRRRPGYPPRFEPLEARIAQQIRRPI